METTNDGKGASQKSDIGFGGSNPFTSIAPVFGWDLVSPPEEKKAFSFLSIDFFSDLGESSVGILASVLNRKQTKIKILYRKQL